jgi:hypothetical protein
MTWTFGHPRDYFIAGIIVGMLFSAWVAVMVGLFMVGRKDRPKQLVWWRRWPMAVTPMRHKHFWRHVGRKKYVKAPGGTTHE